MGLGSYLETKLWLGDNEEEEAGGRNSPGGIIIETLVNIRTVASLTLEDHCYEKYTKALELEDESAVKDAVMLGLVAGYTLGIQFACFGFLFWWGGYLIDSYDYSLDDFNISTFALIF